MALGPNSSISLSLSHDEWLYIIHPRLLGSTVIYSDKPNWSVRVCSFYPFKMGIDTESFETLWNTYYVKPYNYDMIISRTWERMVFCCFGMGWKLFFQFFKIKLHCFMHMLYLSRQKCILSDPRVWLRPHGINPNTLWLSCLLRFLCFRRDRYRWWVYLKIVFHIYKTEDTWWFTRLCQPLTN